jgi:alkylation response protein AidB-like acyl-CoA dehydrogenase
MTGGADFNEVFLTDVRTPADHIVGKRGEGWTVSRSTLKHERNMIGDARQAEFLYKGLVAFAKKVTRNGRPALEDPEIRQRLAELEGYALAHVYSGYRQLTCAARGEDPGPAGLMNKLVSTNLQQKVATLALDLLGDDALLAPDDRGHGMYTGLGGSSGWATLYMYSLGIAIAGGTANIQRNVIAERGYGLPRDAAAEGRR